MSPGFVLGRGNVACVAEVVNGSLKADCTDFTVDDRIVFYLKEDKVKNLMGCICENLSLI